MQETTERPEAQAKTIYVCASVLGLKEFSLLNLGQSEILLYQRAGDEFAVIERFREESHSAETNGNAEILLQGNNASQLSEDFKANAQHTLKFMASNLVAKGQKVILGTISRSSPWSYCRRDF